MGDGFHHYITNVKVIKTQVDRHGYQDMDITELVDEARERSVNCVSGDRRRSGANGLTDDPLTWMKKTTSSSLTRAHNK